MGIIDHFTTNVGASRDRFYERLDQASGTLQAAMEAYHQETQAALEEFRKAFTGEATPQDEVEASVAVALNEISDGIADIVKTKKALEAKPQRTQVEASPHV